MREDARHRGEARRGGGTTASRSALPAVDAVTSAADPVAPESRHRTTASPTRSARGSGRQVSSRDSALVWAIVAVSAAVAMATADAAPTGGAAADVVYRALVAGVIALAASRARRWTWFLLAGVAGLVASGWWSLAAIAALALGALGSWRRRRSRPLGAAVGGLAAQALLHQSWYGFQGASMLIGALAVLPVLVSAHRRCRRRQRRVNLIVAGAAFGLLALASLGFGVAALRGRAAIAEGATAARDALSAARRGDTDAAESLLAQSTDSLERGQSDLDAWWARPARSVPVVAQNAQALRHVLDDSLQVVAGGTGTVSRIGDYQSLAYTSGSLDLNRVGQVAEPIDDAAGIITRTRTSMDGIDRTWLVAPLVDQMDRLDDELARAQHESTLAAQVLKVAPDLLGRSGPRRYFVAFVNPAEERGAGGFVGQYGVLTATDGQLRLAHSGSTTELQAARPVGSRRLTGLADYRRVYGGFQPADYPQDLTFSPDFPSDAEALAQIYEQSGGQPVDGVIKIDPVALAALLQFTGPIQVPGIDQPLTSENAADILMRSQYLKEGERADALVDATRIAFDKLTSGSLPGPQQLVDALGPMVHQRRLMLWAKRPEEQALFRRMAADGSLPAPAGNDVLSVTSQNLGNSKIDAYLRRTITYRARIDPRDGTVSARLVIRLNNDAPAEGLPRIVLGNNRGLPNGTNLLTLTVHSPLGLRSVRIGGRTAGVESGEELGLHAYLLPVEVGPGRSTTVTMDLAGGLDLTAGYRLTAVPQPMVHPDVLTADLTTTPGWKAQRVEDGREVGAPVRRVRVDADPFDQIETAHVRLER